MFLRDINSIYTTNPNYEQYDYDSFPDEKLMDTESKADFFEATMLVNKEVQVKCG